MTANYYKNDHDVEFDVQDVTTWPAMVIATTPEAGKKYAEIVGIKNYVVACDIAQSQGLRMRTVVITPGYLYEADKKSWEARSALDGALQGFSMVPENMYHRG